MSLLCLFLAVALAPTAIRAWTDQRPMLAGLCIGLAFTLLHQSGFAGLLFPAV